MASYRKKGDVWYYRFVDEEGDRREKAGVADRRETELLAAAVELEVARIRAGVYSAEEMARKRRRDVAAADAVKEYLDTKGPHLNPAWAIQIGSYLRRFLAEARVEYLSDITPDRLEKFIARKDREYAGGSTANCWWNAIRAFLRWCRRRGMTDRVATEIATPPKPWVGRDDRRRRAMTEDEFRRIIEAIESTRTLRHFPNRDWAWMLRIARYTGLRRKELWSLNRGSFKDLGGTNPHVRCKAGDTKNGNEARQPIPLFLVPELERWLGGQKEEVQLFWSGYETAPRIRRDMELAGIPETTEEGRVDFHSLRVTFVTWLIRSNPNMKAAQTLARHGDPRLTYNTYAKLNATDLREAIEGAALPLRCPATTHPGPIRRTVMHENPPHRDAVDNAGGVVTDGQLSSEQDEGYSARIIKRRTRSEGAPSRRGGRTLRPVRPRASPRFSRLSGFLVFSPLILT